MVQLKHSNCKTEVCKRKGIIKTDFFNRLGFLTVNCMVAHIQPTWSSHGLWSHENIQQPWQSWIFMLSCYLFQADQQLQGKSLALFSPLGKDIIKLPWNATSCFHQTLWGHCGPGLQLSPCWTALLWLLSFCQSCIPKQRRKTHLKQVNCISYTLNFPPSGYVINARNKLGIFRLHNTVSM